MLLQNADYNLFWYQSIHVQLAEFLLKFYFIFLSYSNSSVIDSEESEDTTRDTLKHKSF